MAGVIGSLPSYIEYCKDYDKEAKETLRIAGKTINECSYIIGNRDNSCQQISYLDCTHGQVIYCCLIILLIRDAQFVYIIGMFRQKKLQDKRMVADIFSNYTISGMTTILKDSK